MLISTVLFYTTICSFLYKSTEAFFLWPKIVSQGSVALLERFGEYRQTLNPGLHWLIPVVDYCLTISLKEKVLDTPPQNCVTLDNAPVKVDAVLYYKIVDPIRSCYNVQDLNAALSNLVTTQVRSEIGKLDLDSTFSARQVLGTVLYSSMNECVDIWGIQVTRVEINEIAPNPDILLSMEKVMAAEREKRAVVLRSEGERSARVNSAAAQADAAVQEAQAEKQATILKAEAEASARALLAEAEAIAIRAVAGAKADATRLQAEATKDGLLSIAQALGNPESALRYEALRQYMEGTAALASSPNAKTIVLPRGDEWLARIGIALEKP